MTTSIRQSFSRIFQTQESLSDADTDLGIRMITLDGVSTLTRTALQGGPFLAAFALALGASNFQIGLLAAAAFLSQPMQLAGLYLVQRFQRRRAITVFCAAIARLAWIPIILIPVSRQVEGIGFLIAWLLFSSLMAGIPAPAWFSLLREVVPRVVLGRVVSKRLALGTASALVLTLLGGFFVDYWQRRAPDSSLYSFSILFLLGLVFGIGGILAISRIPEPAMSVQRDVSLKKLLAMPVRDENYRSLLGFVALWNFALNMATPFFVIYMLRWIGLSMSMVAVLTVCNQVVYLLSLRVWGRLTDRYSNKSVLRVAGPMFLGAVIAWSFTTMPEPYLLTVPLLFVIHILSGISMAGVTLTTSNITLKLAPSGYAHAYMTVSGLAGAVTGAVAPLMAGILADFFSVRELALSLTWSDPSHDLSVYALNFRALDFVFLLAVVVGLYAIHRLSSVREEGEVDERQIVEDLKHHMAAPLRTVSSIRGFRRLVFLPVDRLVGDDPETPTQDGDESEPPE